MTGKHLSSTLPLSFAGLGAIYYGIKMFSLADGNMTTALVIARNVDFIPTIAAMLMSFAPAVVLPLAAYVLYRVRHVVIQDGEGQIVVLLLSAALMAAVFYSSLLTLLMCTSVFLMHRIYLRSIKKKWKRNADWLKFRAELAHPLLVGITLPGIVFGPPWLAQESAEIGGASRVVSVVKETDEYLLYLDRDSRKVVYAKPSDLGQRSFCGGTFPANLQAVTQILNGPIYPACPPSKR
ncbi:hypothetical protein LFT48_17785 [Arthrobacter sp. FW305-123]|nr:hypothetical protein LFT48_17785 [Arthrobacter sp. FW305-123]